MIHYYTAKKGLLHEILKIHIHLFLFDIFTHELSDKHNSLIKSASLQGSFIPPYRYI